MLVRIHICFILIFTERWCWLGFTSVLLFYFIFAATVIYFFLFCSTPAPLMSPQSLVFSTSPSPLLIFLCPFPDPAPIISHPFITLPCSLWLALCLCVIQSLHPLHHSFPCHVLRSLQHFFFPAWPRLGDIPDPDLSLLQSNKCTSNSICSALSPAAVSYAGCLEAFL